MRIAILGVGGTFMVGLARLAQQLGHEVIGFDETLYPPMSLVLDRMGIPVYGYDALNELNASCDEVVVGNVFTRDHPLIAWVLDQGLSYTSGPAWLYQYVLKKRRVIAIAGTHGKTTTACLLVHLFRHCQRQVGFLVGGEAKGHAFSADLGSDELFVIEADEYDTAFFDKQSKFMHYRPEQLLVNALEFDHADIFSDLEAIVNQFALLLRTVPDKGLVLTANDYPAIDDLLTRGVWGRHLSFGFEHAPWTAECIEDGGQSFVIAQRGQHLSEVRWPCIGRHNVKNALAASILANQNALSWHEISEALSVFPGVSRRMEFKGEIGGVPLFEDFAHHPTAIASAVQAMQQHMGEDKRLLCLVQMGSYTMRSGAHLSSLSACLSSSHHFILHCPMPLAWLPEQLEQQGRSFQVASNDLQVVALLKEAMLLEPDAVLLMGNRGMHDITEALLGRS